MRVTQFARNYHNITSGVFIHYVVKTDAVNANANVNVNVIRGASPQCAWSLKQ